jgi:uncharacterized membrane protein
MALSWGCWSTVPQDDSKGVLILESKSTGPEPAASPRPRLTVVVVALSVLVIIVAIVISPASLLDKADLIGYSICHRIPERSFHIGGRQLPLCARCTGTFLGAVLGLTVVFLLGRRRASRMPPASVLLALVTFVALWGFDGLNSYLTLIPGAPYLYEPRNWLRLTTGLLNGLALIIFVLPVYNFTLWRAPTREPVIRKLWELLAFLPAVVLLVLATQAEIDLLLYPLAIVSSLGVLMMLVIICSMLATVVLGREGYAWSWHQALVPLAVGLALAILLLAVMILARDYLTTALGLPF